MPGRAQLTERGGLLALLVELSPESRADPEEQTRLRGIVEDFATDPSEEPSKGPPTSRSLAWTRPGHFGFQEALRAAWLARERREARHRERERGLLRRHGLGPEVRREFRGQLVEVHALFEEARALQRQREAPPAAPPAPPPPPQGPAGEGLAVALPRLRAQEVRHLMGRLGVSVPPPKGESRRGSVDGGLGDGLGAAAGVEDGEDGALTFAGLLAEVRARRRELMRERQDLVEGVLRGFRKNTRGELSMEDVCSIVGELGLFPNSPDLQRHVAQLIEEGDADGSGGWSLAELALLIQRVDERLGQLRRSSEDARAEEMSFSGEEVRRLRDAFDRHSADGEMSHEQAEHAVGLRLGLRLSQRSLAQHLEVVDPACGSLCFVKFMELVRSIQNSQGGLLLRID
ncbi:unnamed protein product [Prorocentrum cordatum]|uniref:EF-hand domain-containing protein n=1 Tax=Prorocentrum cordatum TaxID=2364126 RepID=A0ABN9UZF1_9DINO|nr:unnamed protein product [Polarella glacialis]